MTEERTDRRKGTWLGGLLILLIVYNLINSAVYRFVPPGDETRALAYMALAVAFTACLIAKRRP